MPHSAVLLKIKCIHRATHHTMMTKDFIFYLYSFYCYERIFCVLWIYARSIKKKPLLGRVFRTVRFMSITITVALRHIGDRHTVHHHKQVAKQPHLSKFNFLISLLWHSFLWGPWECYLFQKSLHLTLGWRNMNTIWFVATWVEQRSLPPNLTNPSLKSIFWRQM